ncbi:MAG: CotH kinase family protein [Prevotellaceae bacterium]|nr:CotH kinase family protein [Candidatus Faecinaster equi]
MLNRTAILLIICIIGLLYSCREDDTQIIIPKYNFNTGLPIVDITTCDSTDITSKDLWKNNCKMLIVNPNGTIDYNGNISIKGRGNSTWSYPKKPYSIKLDKKDKVLGMPKHRRWCLLANWADRTLMRNAIAFEISRNTGLKWTPRGKFVEVVLNGKHIGNYYLCEQIKIDEHRVNITNADTSVTSGNRLSGGYIFELDINFDEKFKFKPTITQWPWMFKDPDEVNTAQYDYIVNYVNKMDSALIIPERFKSREFEKYMDLESFADSWFVYELTMNSEISHPKSYMMYKDINGKMTSGPVWDFDYYTFVPQSTNTFCAKYLYYSVLFDDPQFISLVKKRWNLYKDKFRTAIPAFIDKTKRELELSNSLNSDMWPITISVNGDETLNFDEAVERLKSAYLNKLEWLDKQIEAM